MQLLSPLTSDPKAIAREKPAGDHLPYARHVDDYTIETRDGLLMQTIQLRGLHFETADTEELNYRKRLRDAMLQAIGSSRFALYHHVVRRRVDAGLEAEFPDAFSQRLDTAWRTRLATRQLYVNDLFLTLIRRPMQGRLGALDRVRSWLGKSVVDHEASIAHELRQLDTARDALMAAMGSYEPRLLSVYDMRQGPCSEPLEFLSGLFNGELRPVLLPHEDIGQYLPWRRVSFGQETVELGAAAGHPASYMGLLSIKDYPAQTAPGMFDELLRLPFELTISQSFGFVERQVALSRMNLALRRMRSAEDEALSLRAELSNAKDDVAAGRAGRPTPPAPTPPRRSRSPPTPPPPRPRPTRRVGGRGGSGQAGRVTGESRAGRGRVTGGSQAGRGRVAVTFNLKQILLGGSQGKSSTAAAGAAAD